MTSALNRRLPLSGNSLLVGWIFMLFFSCSPSKRVSVDVPHPPKEEQKEIPDKSQDPPKVIDAEKPKTNIEKEKPEVAEKQPDNIPDTNKRNKSTYYIAMVLPFSETEGDMRFLQYYGGAKIAAQELEFEGINLMVHVYDANETDVVNKINTDSLAVIFGPNDEAVLKQIIELGTKDNVPVVSPFFSLSSIENNPQFVQLKPSLKAHFSAIVNHVSANFNPNAVVLVGRNTKADKSWFSYIQSIAKLNYQSGNEKPFSEFFIPDDSLANGSNVFGDLLHHHHKSVFIFPNYSYKDELYLYDAMRRLNAEKGEQQIRVYGMPILKDSEKMSFDFFTNLHITVPASRYVEAERDEVKYFDRKFFDNFGALPDMDAYEGFDHLLFLGRYISRYGKTFTEKLGDEAEPYLQTRFLVQPVKSDGSGNEVDYYENRHLDILEFDGQKFVRIN
ncbi:MAG: ABC transporter substrate-binding protein [Saprospiraceae bacterium]|nr:ABC transporter substrate-binding protein [Saprospiraceae bacterium]